MKKIISSIIIAIMLLTSLTACTESQTKNTSDANPKIQEVNSNLPTLDRAGNEIEIPKEISKIISMAPSITEVLVELGFGDKIIAADKNSEYIKGLPKDIPYIDMMTPDAEQLIALNPDIILASTISMSDGIDPLKPLTDMGICVAYIPSSNSIEGIYEDLMFIAEIIQATNKGQELVDTMKSKIAEIEKISSSITEKKTVYFEIAAAPNLYSFGKGVFLDEMISIVGGINVLSEQESWIAVSDEVILAANPDVIITNVSYIQNPVEEIKSRSGWENLKAVTNDEVYYVDNKSSSLSNHNIIKALEEMAKAVYPDIY